MNQKQNQINIELSDEISKGKYANLAMIAHSSSEFVIDFIQLMPGVPTVSYTHLRAHET